MPENQPYPLFAPPEELAEKGRMNWTSKEAGQYAKWLEQGLEARVKQLLEYVGGPLEGQPEPLLDAIGTKIATLLPRPQFSHGAPENPALTHQGYAMASDVGLLVAQLLLRDFPDVHWTVIRKPKSDMSYNLPALTGFGKIHLEPVGASIAEAFAVLRGHRSCDTWRLIYTFWSEKARAAK